VTLITLANATAWVDNTKVTLGPGLESELLDQIEADVLARIGRAYNTSAWVTPLTTPTLVRKAIAMVYVANLYQRTYSEDAGLSEYALYLLAQAQMLIEGITGLTIDLPLDPDQLLSTSSPSFYPTDLSTASTATDDDRSLGAEKFSMGLIF
jgi:hypothetical protein